MPVSLDSNPATNAASSSAVTTISFTGLTVGAGASTLVAWFNYTAAVSAITIKWGTQSLTQIISAAEAGGVVFAELWGLVSPMSGNQTLTASWTTATSFVSLSAASFNGASLVGGTTTFANATSNTGTVVTTGNTSVTVTTASTHAVVASHSTNSLAISAVNNTEVFIDGTTIFAGNFEVGGATATMTATVSGSCGGGNWVAVGCDIVAAAAAAAAKGGNLPMMGVG